MTEEDKLKAERRLSTTREQELLQSFVRISINHAQDIDKVSDTNSKIDDAVNGENMVLLTETNRRLSTQLTEESITKKGSYLCNYLNVYSLEYNS